MDIVTYVLAKNSANSAIATAIAALPKGLIYRGAVSYVSDLPNNAEIGDCYTIKYKGTSGTTADGHEVAWGNYEGTPQWIDFGGGGGSSITVDDALSDSSENPVQNKVIAKEVDDLKSALDTIVRSAVINDTVSGAIASFPDGADGIPVKDLTVAVEPVQDSHGYDSPWPAGSGVNLLDPAKCSAVGQGGAYGLTVTHDQATAIWTISGTPTLQNASLSFNFCTYSDFSLSGKGYQVQAFPISGTPIKSLYGFRNEAENKIAIIIDTVANPTVNMMFKVSVAATAQTAWSPYSNICPISGWTGANVTRTGKNLLALMGANTTDAIPTINETTGEVSIADTTAIKWTSKPFGYSDVVAEQTYIFSATGIKYGRIGGSMNTAYPNAGAGNIPDCTTSGGGITALVTKNTTARTFTPHFTGRIYWHFCTDTDNGSSHQAFTMTPMIEIGSTASSFEPYSGTTYPIPLGQTVYGGTLDVTTGKLTVDRAIMDLGTLTWYTAASQRLTRFRAPVIGIKQIGSPNVLGSIVCSNYPTKTANQTYQGTTGVSLQQNSADIYIYDPQTESMTTAEFKSAMSGVQLCYELATPIVYDLTPTEVKTLLGENNIWADCGDSTVNYHADTKLYTDKKIAAPASPAPGQYLSWNGSAWVAASLPVYNGGVA